MSRRRINPGYVKVVKATIYSAMAKEESLATQIKRESYGISPAVMAWRIPPYNCLSTDKVYGPQ